MRCQIACSLLVISSTAFAQSEDIFVDEPPAEEQQQPEQQPGAYPDGYPQAYPVTCNPPCPSTHACREGACELVAQTPPPGGGLQPQPQPQAVAQPAYDPRYANAARRKGMLGLIGAALVLGLGTASAATTGSNDVVPSLPLGGATVVTHLIFGLLSSGGGRAARRGGGRGIPALRITGWITWVLALAGGLSLVALGASDVDVNAGPIIGVTALGAVSLISFGIDGIVGAGQARRASGEQARTLSPVLYAAPNLAGGGMTGLFGMNATW